MDVYTGCVGVQQHNMGSITPSKKKKEQGQVNLHWSLAPITAYIKGVLFPEGTMHHSTDNYDNKHKCPHITALTNAPKMLCSVLVRVSCNDAALAFGR